MVLYQNGNEVAFRTLYYRHAGKIFGFIKKRVRNQEQVSDIFQEVFIKIHKSKHLFNRTLPALPWIFTVTRTVMIDNLRKEKFSSNRSDMDLDDFAQPPLNETSPSENFEVALSQFSQLPSFQKTALEMRYIEDKTFDEIALRLNTTPVNVRQLVSRGLKRIKAIVDGGKT